MLAAGQVLTEHGSLRWCPVHSMALTHTTYHGLHWHPLTARTIHLALSWARAWGCGHLIHIVTTTCPKCKERACSA